MPQLSAHFDFPRLLSMTVNRGLKLPHLGEEELELMVEAVEMCSESWDAGTLFMDVLGSFELRGVVWAGWRDWARHVVEEQGRSRLAGRAFRFSRRHR